jgi:acetyl-CoA C-acetyltransferase
MTINRVCGSGLQAIVSAGRQVALGESDIVLAGGIENMDQAPFVLPKARYGYRMGVTAENVAEKYGVSRDEADEYSLRSHQRASEAIQTGAFAEQIVPVEIRQKKHTITFTRDEHVRANATAEGFARLAPVFKKDGSVTAGNSSGINDGAAFMLVTRRQTADQRGLPVAGRLVSYAVAGVDPAYMGMGMVPATRKALERAGLTIDDVDLFEVNEAFASIAVACGRELGIPGGQAQPARWRHCPGAPDWRKRGRADRQAAARTRASHRSLDQPGCTPATSEAASTASRWSPPCATSGGGSADRSSSSGTG